jgi:TRAP-type uncharacterized transport system fused permease subunit
MTPRRWAITGWALITATVLLAVVSVSEAFAAIRPTARRPFPPQAGGTRIDVPVLLLAVVLGVLAGVAFFTGLACFFWNAAQQRRRRLDQILYHLEGRSTGIRPF